MRHDEIGCFLEILLMQIGQSIEDVLSWTVKRSLYVSFASSTADGGASLEDEDEDDDVAGSAALSPIADDSCDR